MAEKKNNSVWSQSIPLKEQVSVVKRLIQLAGPNARKKFLFAAVLTFLISILQGLIPFLLGNFINNNLTKTSTTVKTILFFALLFSSVRILNAIFNYIQMTTYEDAAQLALNEVRRKLYAKLHTLGMRYFDQTPGGALVTRVMNDTESFFDFWFLFLSIITTVASVISTYYFMFQLDESLTYWMFLILPIILLSIWYYQRISSSVYRKMRERLSVLNAKLAESVNGIATIKNFSQEKRIAEEYFKESDDYFNSRISMVKTDSLWLSPLNNLLLGITITLVYLYIGKQSISHSVIAAGVTYSLVSLVGQIFNPLQQVQSGMSTFQDGIVSGYRASKILDDDTYAPAQNPNANKKITKGKIEFRNVSFAYDDKNIVLKNLSFIAEPGQTIALVGHTGSGKSSTINALMRFYEFQEGQILIDDNDIRDIDPKELRKKMGLVLQDAFMFYGDVKNNIRMYNKAISNKKIIEATKFVSADDFIQRLPNGYDTKITEGGTSLSGGQKQLISFARTIVTNPKILILDEATANIDTQTENLIQTALKKMRSNRTTIAIAHRLSTIKDADLILVLDKGIVVERGNHQSLIKKKGYYYNLYKMQSNS
ncbi:MAG: ABC transporter ATP-binding protein/permease [Lactobacillaceae bacterium]|jgi:ATP-binding cassette subfamily B protein|nr:ABC transporter ATP-binding protein/permease [Lactobacillaceae bacterium]